MPVATTLHMLCGKIASGKSTFAKTLSADPKTIMISEDLWLSGLYGDELVSIADYVRCSERLKQTIAPHIVALLKSGLSVVLDFPANTREQRLWIRHLFEEAGCHHKLHYFDVPDQVCKARLKARNASGTHKFLVSEDVFDKISSYFQPPQPDEAFDLEIRPVR
ncbi:ATP-binding protein [uncultured Roseibium sp.]|uniref:AAA family ATPase n=1 Tax=uncultured Roseibium sp. TaxID=1936171 RepID=UPI002622038C|nr:ATP-binding protein [uncultured Roseibium sp.]